MTVDARDEARRAPAGAAKLVELRNVDDPTALFEVTLQPRRRTPHDDVTSHLDDVESKGAGVVVRDPKKAIR